MRQRLARRGYALLLRIAVPLYWLRLRWRGRREPLYSTAIGERFGVYREAIAPGALWIHAVSLGETRAAVPLLDALRAARPGVRFVLTMAPRPVAPPRSLCCAKATASSGCRSTRRARCADSCVASRRRRAC